MIRHRLMNNPLCVRRFASKSATAQLACIHAAQKVFHEYGHPKGYVRPSPAPSLAVPIAPCDAAPLGMGHRAEPS